MRKLLTLIILAILPLICLAQNPLDQRTSFSVSNEPLATALVLLSKEAEVGFTFSNNIIPDGARITVKFWRAKLSTILDEMLSGTSIQYEVIDRQIVFFLPWDSGADSKKFTVSGFIEDKTNGERLIGANIFSLIGNYGSYSNEYGFYSITLPSGPVELNFSFLGYQTEVKKFYLVRDTVFQIELTPSVTLQEVVVSATELDKSALLGTNVEQSTDNIPIGQIMLHPRLGGEPDILRTAHTMAGVQSGADGVGGLYVRGGNADQNLFLLDGVPVYNPLHALGIFSVFNSNSIKSAQLIKGSFPARYGGRLSSVLDIRTREGNNQNYSANIGLSLISTDLTLEGPIQKGKSSFIVSGRRSLTDAYLKPISAFIKERNGEMGASSYYFYDFNAKINHTFSEKDKLYLSIYTGGDNYDDNTDFEKDEVISYFAEQLELNTREKSEQKFSWGNTIAALRWNHVFGHKLFSNTTLTFSNFHYDSKDFYQLNQTLKESSGIQNQEIVGVTQYNSDIQDFAFKMDFDYIPSLPHYVKFGFSATRHKFRPGLVTYDNNFQLIDFQDFNFTDTLKNSPTSIDNEYVAYVEDQFHINKFLTVELGLYGSLWDNPGKRYWSLEPRVSGRILLNDHFFITGSYSKMTQYLHQLTNSGIGLPIDLWVPSTEKIKPQKAQQTSMSLNYLVGQTFKFSLEGYHKKMENLITFQEVSTSVFLDARNYENEVTAGRGRSYGLEFSFKKQKGSTTGWISYGFSKTDRQFDQINNGERFPFKYDRTHDFKIVVAHKITPNIELAADWIYGTGSAITLPVNKYIYPSPFILLPSYEEDLPITNYSKTNSYRLPAYHRLDFNINFSNQLKNGKQVISLGAYNLYNRKNPLFYNLRNSRSNSLQRELVQVSILPFVPSLSYRFIIE